MDWHGDRQIDRALVGIRAHPHIVVFCLNVQAGGSHGNSLHAFRTPAGVRLIASRFGFDNDFFYVCAFDGDAAAYQMSTKRYRARWVSKWNGNSVARLGA